jgi:hypothetical protein
MDWFFMLYPFNDLRSGVMRGISITLREQWFHMVTISLCFVLAKFKDVV